MNRRWIVKRTNPEYITYLASSISVSPLFAQILISRGIKTTSDARDFLDAGITKLSDPFDIPGMLQTVERIRSAIKNRETVLVHGDYDADGITAAAIMVHALCKAGIDAQYFIPHRIRHGYGFNKAGVDAARSIGAALIITVDCGIGSFEASEYARHFGIDVIITDHHEPVRGKQDEDVGPRDHILNSCVIVPDVTAVINPKCSTESNPLTILSGAGIAFKIAQAMAIDRAIPFSEDELLQMLDLAAIGTIADVVPMLGENRVIVKEAMKYINGNVRSGIAALKKIAGIEGRKIKAGSLSFNLVPRINAAGRIADANDVVKLLLSESSSEVESYALWLDRLNSNRQKVEESVYNEAMEMLKKSPPDRIIVLAREGWHPGVIGIVAAKIAESFQMPAFIFNIDDGIAKGSCRSIDNFDICGGLSECSDLLFAYGGHKKAAGLKLNAKDIPAFEERMLSIFKQKMPSDTLAAELEIDAGARLDEICNTLIEEIDLLEPFGCGNSEPLIGSKNLSVKDLRIVGNGHLKLKLNNGTVSHDAIGFNMGQVLDDLSDSIKVDAAFTPSWNEWNDNRYIQLILKGIRPAL